METRKIIVTGDVALDENIYKGNRKSPEVKGYGTLIKETKGGSHLLFEIISETRSDKTFAEAIKQIQAEKEKVKDKPGESEKLEKKIQALNDTRSKWETLKCQFGLKDGVFDSATFPPSMKTYATYGLKEIDVPETYKKIYDKKFEAWKVTEMIGWGQENIEEKDQNNKENKNNNEKKPDDFQYSPFTLSDLQSPDIIVIDDGGNNFRNQYQAWADLLIEQSRSDADKGTTKNNPQVILKTAYPLGHGKLFSELISRFKNKLTIITSIDEIRKEDVLISKGVSWEQTALDLVYELSNNKAINKLLQCKRLIISLQSEGALYLEMDEFGEILKCRLLFDPENLESEWVTKFNIEGGVFGLMSCFTAAITLGYQEAMVNGKFEKDLNMEDAITKALSIMRRYKIIGHGMDKRNPKFQFECVCSEILLPHSQFASAFIPIPSSNQKPDEFLAQDWTILEGNYKPTKNKKPEPLFDTAFRFALYGNKELANTPFLKINKLTTYDRSEIEALHNIKNLISDYLKEDNPEKPLSLAVFGMPGSGKSFAVKQLAKSIDLPLLEFNLSQFTDVKELEGAFHRVRDKVLEGKSPIVFWDEFDSQAYKWMQYLLAPMQDGNFQVGQITHPIGKSIFVFAGGTSYTYETFGIKKPQKPDPKDIIALKDYELILNSYNDFILKKGPDFKSRLSGYLNIQGPNQLEMLDEVGKILKDVNGNVVYNEDDVQYPVRRALFIRVICGKKDNDELNIDHGLLHALIKTRKFAHGSRSMEKVLSYLKTKNSNKLQRSNLPTVSILNMLVDEDFIGLLEEDKFFEFQAFKIAPKIHQNWIKIGDTQGWKLEYHKDYNYLPSHMKDENIAAARRIQKVLDAIKPKENLKIVAKEEAEFYKAADFKKVIENQKFLELMAIEEHKGWVETKEALEWKFDINRNDDRKLHNCIIGWDEKLELSKGNFAILSEDDKKKDKNSIKNFSDILEAAGFVIIEL